MATEKEFTKNAEQAVGAFEKLKLGVAWRSGYDTATAAVAELRVFATNILFPSTQEPIGSDLMSDLEALIGSGNWHINTSQHSGLAELHRSCLDSHPLLAKVIRGRMMRARLEEVAS